jgi:hypothetical protein
MATTTTINPTKDNWIYESSPTSKYGSGANIKIGVSGSITHMSGIFEFDVSSFTTPSDIVSAMFSLTANNSAGSTTNTVTLARLSKDFDESNSNWNYSDDPTAWTTAGAMDDAETTETTYTFEVGDLPRESTDISVDIRELVIDAINRRSGVLRFICYYSGTPSSSGYTTFDSRTNSSGDYPEVAITVADRIYWTNAAGAPYLGDVTVAGNWSGATVPTSNDYAMFLSGSEDATSGKLDCNTCFIGGKYKGSIGTTSTSLQIDCNSFIVHNRWAEWHVDLNESTSGAGCVARVGNTSGKDGSCSIKGDCSVIVNKTRTILEIDGSDITSVDTHGGGRVQLEEDTVIRSTKSQILIDKGVTTAVFADGTSVYFSDTSGTKGDITVAGNSTVTVYADEIDDVLLYSGRVGFMGNSSAPIETGNVFVYGSGSFNTRTNSTTFTLRSGKTITMYGGSVLFDASTELNIA